MSHLLRALTVVLQMQVRKSFAYYELARKKQGNGDRQGQYKAEYTENNTAVFFYNPYYFLFLSLKIFITLTESPQRPEPSVLR